MNTCWLILLLINLLYSPCFSYLHSRFDEPEIGPKGLPVNKSVSCRDLSPYNRFNLHSVVGHIWFVFYYWSEVLEPTMYQFRVPSKKDRDYLHYLLDHRTSKTFNWSEPMLLLKDNYATTELLVEKGDRGQYWLYPLTPEDPIGPVIKPIGIRLRQVEQGKYIGLIHCRRGTAFIMSRTKDLPPAKKLKDEAAKLGFVGRKGRSYLYQGHEWMPSPDMDEREYWHRLRRRSLQNNLGIAQITRKFEFRPFHPDWLDTMDDIPENQPIPLSGNKLLAEAELKERLGDQRQEMNQHVVPDVLPPKPTTEKIPDNEPKVELPIHYPNDKTNKIPIIIEPKESIDKLVTNLVKETTEKFKIQSNPKQEEESEKDINKLSVDLMPQNTPQENLEVQKDFTQVKFLINEKE